MSLSNDILLDISAGTNWVPILVFFVIILLLILVGLKYLKPDTTIKETEYTNIDSIKSSRYVFIVMGIFYPIYGYTHIGSPYCLYDPIYQRLILSVLCIIAFLLSYKSLVFKKNFDKILVVYYYLFLGHFFFLLFKNNFAFEYMLGLMIVLCGAFTILKHLREGYFIVAFIISAATISILFNETSNFLEIKSLITICIAMSLVIILTLFTKANKDTQLLIANKFVNEINALMFVYDANGKIIYASNSISSILGFTPLDVTEGKWNKNKYFDQIGQDKFKKYIQELALGNIESKNHKYKNYLTIGGQEKWISWRDKRIEGDLV